ncbi:MAG TPA: hypothetical protein VGJ92_12680 [Methanocella sp.]
MTNEIKPVPFGLASGIVTGIGAFLMSLGMGSSMVGYGFGTGMMGTTGSSYTLMYSIMCLVMGFFVGLIGGGALAWLYNYFNQAARAPDSK